jgi:hypothetical protein
LEADPSDYEGISDYRLRGISPPWLRDHLTLLASAGVSALLVVRLMQVSKFRTATALALIGSGNPVPVVVGLFVSFLPTIALFLGGVQVVYHVDRLKVLFREREWGPATARMSNFLLLFVLAAAYLPWFTVFVWLLLGGMALLVSRARLLERFPEEVLGYFVILFFLVLSNQTVWLAPEVIRLREEGHVVAYTVEDEGLWSTLLTEEDRVIRFVPSADVLSRTVCELEGQGADRTLFEIIRREPNPTPPCPETSPG